MYLEKQYIYILGTYQDIGTTRLNWAQLISLIDD